MTRLEELPFEVLQKILITLPRPTLTKLPHASPLFRTIVPPLLYRAIALILDDEEARSWKKVSLLFRTLVEQPDLAQLVKELKIKRSFRATDAYMREETGNDSNIGTVPDSLGSVFAAINQCPNSFRQVKIIKPEKVKLPADPITYSLGCMITSILSRIHSIEVLQLDAKLLLECPLLQGFLQHAGCFCLTRVSGYHGFRRLRVLQVIDDMSPTSLYHKNWPICWTIPDANIRELNIVLPLEMPLGMGSSLSLTNLVSLVLLSPRVRSADLKGILVNTPNLKHLEYRFVQDLIMAHGNVTLFWLLINSGRHLMMPYL